MSKDNVVNLLGKPLITPAKLAEDIATFDKVFAFGEKDGEPYIMCSDGYEATEMIYKLEQFVWLMKMELFGLPEFVEE